MKRVKILGCSLMFLMIFLSLPVSGETIILQSEKGKQHAMPQIMSISPRDIITALNRQKLVHIRREEYDKPNHTISFLSETGNVYHSCQAQDIILEADVYNEELYTLEAKCFPEYSTRKVKAIPHEDSIMEMPSPEKQEHVRKQYPWAWIEKMDLYIRKYNDSQPQGETVLKVGTVTKPYNQFCNRLVGLVMKNDQAKVIFYNRYDQSTDIEVCSYPLDGSEASSSLKVPAGKDFPKYRYHDSESLYLIDRSETEGGDYFCQLIKMNIETGDKQIIFNDINIGAYGFDAGGNFNYLSYYKESKKNVYSVKKVSLSDPQQYIDKIFIPSSFQFFGSESKWDKQLEEFIIPQYKRTLAGPIYDIFLLDPK